jgi:5-methylcytosine-specific restriction endonuclease McrA
MCQFRLNKRSKKDNIQVRTPHIKSRAAYIMLRNQLGFQTIDQWLQFRDTYLNQFETLTCTYCHKTNLEKDTDDLSNLATVDHIKPLAAGGKRYDYKNLTVACHKCNNRKGDKWKEFCPPSMRPLQFNSTGKPLNKDLKIEDIIISPDSNGNYKV